MSDVTTTYSNDVLYNPGDRVSYLGYYYIAKQTMRGIVPTTLGNYWEQTFSFLDVLKESSPAFLFEDLSKHKIQGIEAFYSEFATFLDILYMKIKKLNNQLNVDSAETKFLYELGYMLGLDELAQLEKYLNADGTVNTDYIDEEIFNKQVQKQKMRIKTAVSYYLQRGTIKAFQNFFTGYGGLIKLIELWESYSVDVFDTEVKDVTGTNTELGTWAVSGYYYDVTSQTNIPILWYPVSGEGEVYPLSGSVFDIPVFKGEEGITKDVLDNSLFTKYSTLLFNYSGGAYQDDYTDLEADLSSNGYPEVSAGFTIKQYQQNEKNCSFLLSTSGDMLFKTNDDPLDTNFTSFTWYKFTTDITEFILSDDYIFMIDSLNNLYVYNNTLETESVSATSFSIDNGNCYFVQPIENLNRLIIDRGKYVEVRRLSDFFLLNRFTKYDENIRVEFAVEKNDDDYLIIYDNGKGNIITGLNSSVTTILDVSGNTKLYDLTTLDIYNAYFKSYNNITLICNASGEAYRVSLSFNDTYDLTSPSEIPLYTGAEFISDTRYFEKLIFLSTGNLLYIYDLYKNTFTYNPLAIIESVSGYSYTDLFFTDKINIYDRNHSGVMLQDIIAWNIGTTTLYKSHYFDAKVLRRYEVLQFFPTTTSIEILIKMLKPAHTELRNLYLMDDIGVFGYGGFGLGRFGYGEFGMTDEELEDFINN